MATHEPVGQYLRELRAQTGLSVTALAALLPSYESWDLSRWEHGRRAVTLRAAHELATVFAARGVATYGAVLARLVTGTYAAGAVADSAPVTAL